MTLAAVVIPAMPKAAPLTMKSRLTFGIHRGFIWGFFFLHLKELYFLFPHCMPCYLSTHSGGIEVTIVHCKSDVVPLHLMWGPDGSAVCHTYYNLCIHIFICKIWQCFSFFGGNAQAWGHIYVLVIYSCSWQINNPHIIEHNYFIMLHTVYVIHEKTDLVRFKVIFQTGLHHDVKRCD